MADRGERKRRSEPEEKTQGPHSIEEQQLGDSLSSQIAHFEELSEKGAGTAPVPKKPARIHSLTQNTTHRKIR